MPFQELYFALFLISPAIRVLARTESCTRHLPPGSTDCSTTTGECDTLYRRNNTDVPVSQLPFPASNTRSCYRTCFEDGACKAFEAHSSPQTLHVVVNGSGYTFQHVASPQYGEGNYRKSTNCRYSIECDEGQNLAYTVDAFDLEDEVSCSHGEECVDWVEITFPHLNLKKRFCGRGEFGESRVVGHNKILFEFASNRRVEDLGFLYTIRCLDSNLEHGASIAEYCNKPLGSQPPIIRPEGLDYDPTTAPVQTVVGKKSVLVFRDDLISVFEGKQRLYKTKGIERLDVESDLSKVTKINYPGPNRKVFSGYGILAINDGRAYYFQTGANPILQPSKKEEAVILRIDMALNDFLGTDTFDVKDDLDYLEYLWRPVFQRPQMRPRRPFVSATKRFYENAKVSRLAAMFGNACNPILRASACDYQAIVQGRDCRTGMLL